MFYLGKRRLCLWTEKTLLSFSTEIGVQSKKDPISENEVVTFDEVRTQYCYDFPCLLLILVTLLKYHHEYSGAVILAADGPLNLLLSFGESCENYIVDITWSNLFLANFEGALLNWLSP